MKGKLLGILWILIFFVATVVSGTGVELTSSSPAEIHVYPGQSIQAAIDSAAPGDTIIVHAGTYNEKIVIDKPLTLLGAQHDVDPRGGAWKDNITTINPGEGNTGINITSSDVVVNGFEVTGGVYGIYVGYTNVSNIRILYNDLNNNTKYGCQLIGIGSDVNHVIVSKNYFHHNGRNGLKLVDVTDCLVDSNEFAYNGFGTEATKPEYKFGILLEDERYKSPKYSPAIRNVFTNNLFHDNNLGAINMEVMGYASSPYWTSTIFLEDTVVYGNNFEGNSSVWGINVSNDYKDDGTQDGFGPIADVDARFNWWSNESGPSGVGPGAGVAISNNVTYSPWLGYPYGTVPMTYHVDPTGKIQDAIDEASSGDTILVHEGTYNEGLTVDKQGLTILGLCDVILDGTGIDVDYGIHITADNVVIKNFHIANFTYGWGWGVQLTGADYCLLENLLVEKCNSGINLYKGSDYNIIQNCEINGIGGHGISIYGSDLGCTHNIIRNNRMIGCAWYMPYGKYHLAVMPIFSNASYNIIERNILTGTGVGYGMCLWGYTYGRSDMPEAGNLIRANNISSFDAAVYIRGRNPDTGTLNLVTNTSILENNIKNNRIGVYVEGFDSNIIGLLHHNNIEGNAEYGALFNATYGTAILDARFNWWGNATGPYHPTLNPKGTGDAVSDNVNFDHWLLEEYPPPLPSPVLYIAPSEVEYWTPAYGETFTVEVKIDEVTDLAGYEFKLYWDTNLLDLVNVEITPPWPEGKYITAKNYTDESVGLYWLSVGAYDIEPFTGSTTLAILTFKITYDPIYPENRTCILDLTNTKLSAPAGEPIYHMVYDGKYSIFSTKPKIEVKPSTYTVHVLGETFKVDIYVSDIVNLYNYTFKLSYDTTLLDAVNLEIGPFLNPPIYAYKFIIDDANGEIWLWVWSTSGTSTSGSGVLATITFKATKATTWTKYHPNILECALDLHDTMLITDTGIEVPHDVEDGLYQYVPKPGDLDCDGHVGLTDLRIVAYYYDPAYNPIADINEDGVVDIYDLEIVAYYYGEDC